MPDDDGDRVINTESIFSYFSSAFGGPLATYEACLRTITRVSEFLTPKFIQVTIIPLSFPYRVLLSL